MAVIYANQIIKRGQSLTNPFTIDDVPAIFKAATLANLASRGYDGYGLPL
jgi:hypothetical protein